MGNMVSIKEVRLKLSCILNERELIKYFIFPAKMCESFIPRLTSAVVWLSSKAFD